MSRIKNRKLIEAMQINLISWSLTDVGLRRELNEDSFLVDNSLGLYIVADGMGGHQGGEVASKMAVETVKEVIEKSTKDKRRAPSPRVLLAEAYSEASRRIYDKSQSGHEVQGMGTTLVTVLRQKESVFIANVGDSRCYLSSQGSMWQLTEDHSLINELLRSGQIAETEVEKFVAKNVITRSVGFEREVQPDIIEKPLQADDFFVLCSDGLSGMVRDKDIAQQIQKDRLDPGLMVRNLVEKAKANGGDDNVTVVLIAAQVLKNS